MGNGITYVRTRTDNYGLTVRANENGDAVGAITYDGEKGFYHFPLHNIQPGGGCKALGNKHVCSLEGLSTADVSPIGSIPDEESRYIALERLLREGLKNRTQSE